MSHADLWIDQHDAEDVLRNSPEDVMVAQWMLDLPDDPPPHQKLFVGDGLEVIWLVQSQDEVQPIIFPMRLHRHDQDCGRA